MEKDKEIDLKLYYMINDMRPGNLKNIEKHHAEIARIESDLKELNVNRGGKNTSGFVFEYMHATDKNIDFLKDKKDDIIHVISDNGVADFEITRQGGIKELQQAKAGYHGTNKYKITPEKYKGQKLVVDRGNRELLDYAKKRNMSVEQSNISKTQADRLTKAMKKEVEIRRKITKKKAVNAPLVSQIYGVSSQIKAAHNVGKGAMKSVVPFAVGMSFGENLYQYLGGNIELGKALGNVVVDTTRSAGVAYVSSASMYLASDVVKKIIGDGAKKVAQKAVGMIVKTSAGKMIVSIGQFLAEMSIGAGTGFLLGMAIGCGKAICQIVVATEKMQANKIHQANSILNQTIDVMEKAYDDLEKTIKEEFEKWDNSVNSGFDLMRKGVINNSLSMFSEGLNNVTSVINTKVFFSDIEEFDKFFFDSEAVLEL